MMTQFPNPEHPMPADFAVEISAFLGELAALAGDAALPYFRTPLVIENKGDVRFDPVTIADRAVEQVLRDAIRRRYPAHSIIGEEYGAHRGDAAFCWVIDPIDGTRAFVSGLPTWGTLVALCEGDKPRFGLMSQPFVGEMFIGGNGASRWTRGAATRLLKTRGAERLETASLFATTPEMFAADIEWPRFEQLTQRVRSTRYGADCYAYCMLAAGYVDLVVEAGLGFYDIAALVPIVEGAGGVVSNWEGSPIRAGGRVLAAANAALHVQALAILRGA